MSFKQRAIVLAPFALLGALTATLVAPDLNVDTTKLLAHNLPHWVIPHYPPGYPLFSRSIALVVEFLTTGAVTHNFNNPGQYTGAQVGGIVLVQHLLTVLASGYLASKVTSGTWSFALLVAVLYLNPLTFSFAHTLLTEGLTPTLIYMLVGKTVDVIRAPKLLLADLVIYALMAILAAVVRFQLLSVALILPAALILRSLFASRFQFLDTAKVAGIGAGVIVAVAIISSALTASVAAMIGTEPRSILGRGFAFIITGVKTEGGRRPGFVVTPDMGRLGERVQFTEVERHDFEIIARSRNDSWVEPFNEIALHAMDRCATCSSEDSWVLADHRMNAVARRIMLSGDPVYLKHWGLRIVQYVIPVASSYEPRFLMHTYNGPFGHDPTNPGAIVYQDIKSAFHVADLNGFLRPFESVEWFLRMFGFSLAAVLALAAFLFNRRSTTGLVATALVLSGAAYAIGSSAVTVYIQRYGQALDLLSIVAIVLASTSLIAVIRRPTSPNA